MGKDDRQGPLEVALVGELTDCSGDLCERLLDVPLGGECILYFDSPGGNPYRAMALMSLIVLRGVKATGIVAGECSSAALWPFAACRHRIVTPFSALLFHPMRWQSEEHVILAEAAEWARHFAQLEGDMDQLLANLFQAPHELIKSWITPGRYVAGRELAAAGLAELVELKQLRILQEKNGAPTTTRRKTRGKHGDSAPANPQAAARSLS